MADVSAVRDLGVCPNDGSHLVAMEPEQAARHSGSLSGTVADDDVLLTVQARTDQSRVYTRSVRGVGFEDRLVGRSLDGELSSRVTAPICQRLSTL